MHLGVIILYCITQYYSIYVFIIIIYTYDCMFKYVK